MARITAADRQVALCLAGGRKGQRTEVGRDHTAPRAKGGPKIILEQKGFGAERHRVAVSPRRQLGFRLSQLADQFILTPLETRAVMRDN
jgi:hypothetical protein